MTEGSPLRWNGWGPPGYPALRRCGAVVAPGRRHTLRGRRCPPETLQYGARRNHGWPRPYCERRHYVLNFILYSNDWTAG